MTSKDFVLHPGRGKSGSSAIQDWLRRNSRKLSAEGIHCLSMQPHRVETESAESLQAAQLQQGSNGKRLRDICHLNGADLENGEAAKALQQFSQMLRVSDARIVILSSEFLFGSSLDFLTRLADIAREQGFNPRAVLYLREQAAWRISAYGQAVKTGDTAVPLRNYLNRHLEAENPDDDYASVVERYLQAFDKVSVRLFERSSLTGGDVVLDWMEQLSLDPSDYRLREGKVNESISLRELELLRFLNRSPRLSSNASPSSLLQMAGESPQESSASKEVYRFVEPFLVERLQQKFQSCNQRLSALLGRNEEVPLFSRSFPETWELIDQLQYLDTGSVVELLSAPDSGKVRRKNAGARSSGG